MPSYKTCPVCGSSFRSYPSRERDGRAHFCSGPCRTVWEASPDHLAERLWSKVDHSAGPDACWPFLAHRTPDGYGVLRLGRAIGKHSERAHRLAWVLTNGPIPDGLFVCHTCDNPPCCNPAHLFLGTVQTNTADMDSKGRRKAYSGPRSYAARLTEERVREIRSLRETEGWSYRRLAAHFGVGTNAIGELLRGQSWRHVK